MRLLARDTRVPRTLRGIAAIGLLPIPGPVDEALLLLVAPVFALFYREPMRDAWLRSAAQDEDDGDGDERRGDDAQAAEPLHGAGGADAGGERAR